MSQVTSFTHKAVGDQGSDTDWCLTEYDIQVTTVINADYLAAIAPALTGLTSNPADIMGWVYSQLMARRKTLSFLFNGVEMIPNVVAGQKGSVDADNGPKPESFTYSQMTNTTWLATYHIKARYWLNLGANARPPFQANNQPGNPVIYNRWTEAQAIDNCGMTTRTRRGKYVIRSDNVAGQVADFFRNQMAAVGVPKGFLRQSSSYTVDASGLGIEYEVTDKEQFQMPPFPAYHASGTYNESVAKTGMGHRTATVSITLRGGNGVPGIANSGDQTALILLCVGIAGSILRAAGTYTLLLSAEMRVNLYENEVSYTQSVLLARTGRRLRLARAGLGKFGITLPATPSPLQGFMTIQCGNVPGSDPLVKIPYPVYGSAGGSAGFLLRAAAYFDPSIAGRSLDGQGIQMTGGLEPGQAGRTVEGP